MTELPASDNQVPQPVLPQVPGPLAEYADRLLLSTGLNAEDALLIASRQLEPARGVGRTHTRPPCRVGPGGGPAVSVTLFDLGQRLRAATLGHPVARAAFAPVLPPIAPIAVMISGSGDNALVQATDGARFAVASGPTALSALTDLDVSPGADPRTLVVADRDQLARLHELAYTTEPAAACAGAAAVVGWWAQRADHPGTGAVLDLVTACSARWTLGVPPVHERELGVWRQWLGVADRSPRGLLELARLVSREPTLPGPGGTLRRRPRVLGRVHRASRGRQIELGLAATRQPP